MTRGFWPGLKIERLVRDNRHVQESNVGAKREPGAVLARRLRRRLTLASLTANAVGAAIMFVFVTALFAAPVAHIDASMAAIVVYVAAVTPLALAWSTRRNRALWRWLSADRPPDDAERSLVLRQPLREVVVPAALWGGAAVLLSALELLTHGEHRAHDIGLAVLLGGLTTCAMIYLLAERTLRPAIRRALATRAPERPVGPGVAARLIMAWGLATAIPLAGLANLAVAALSDEFTKDQFAAAALTLASAALIAGLAATVLIAASLGQSIAGVRRALSRVRAGELDTRVAVDDGSEIGLLQAGFNEMVEGLRERERLRDLFGRHVGKDVARQALRDGVSLGGEVRHVAALFVDVIGSTGIVATRPPQEVVGLLNQFFAVVAGVVTAHGGWINKFEGDAALCVFGAPAEQPDAAGRAMAAARALRERLDREVSELDAAIGLSAGSALAGNVGTEERLEYTVIGDPVNEAARLCDLAKRHPGRLLASEAILGRASAGEAAHWRLGERESLRGRPAPTRVAVPISGEPPAGRGVRAPSEAVSRSR